MKTFPQKMAIFPAVFLLATAVLSPQRATAHENEIEEASVDWSDCEGTRLPDSSSGRQNDDRTGYNGRKCVTVGDSHGPTTTMGYRFDNGSNRCSTNQDNYDRYTERSLFEMSPELQNVWICFYSRKSTRDGHSHLASTRNEGTLPLSTEGLAHTIIEGGRFVVPSYNSGEDYDVSFKTNRPTAFALSNISMTNGSARFLRMEESTSRSATGNEYKSFRHIFRVTPANSNLGNTISFTGTFKEQLRRNNGLADGRVVPTLFVVATVPVISSISSDTTRHMGQEFDVTVEISDSLDKLYQPLSFTVDGGQITETGRTGTKRYSLTISPDSLTSDVVVKVDNPGKPTKRETFGGDFTAEIDATRLPNGNPFLITWTLSKAVKDFNADEAITEGATGCAATFASAELDGGSTFAKVYTCTVTPASPSTDVVLYVQANPENLPVTEHGGQLTGDGGRTVLDGRILTLSESQTGGILVTFISGPRTLLNAGDTVTVLVDSSEALTTASLVDAAQFELQSSANPPAQDLIATGTTNQYQAVYTVQNGDSGAVTFKLSGITDSDGTPVPDATYPILGYSADTSPPEVSLVGDSGVDIPVGGVYTAPSPGVTTTDDRDTTVLTIVGPGGKTALDLSTTGVYTYTYTVTDAAGNIDETTRTVTVFTLMPPSITFRDSGISTADRITNDAKLTVADVLDAATWEYSTDSGAAWNDGSGTRFTLPGGVYADNVVRVRQTVGSVTSEFAGLLRFTMDLTLPTVTTFDTPEVGEIGVEQSLTITFSELVDRFRDNDFTTSTGVIKISVSGAGSTYTIRFTPIAATFKLILGANKLRDIAGNLGPPSEASVSGTATPDTTPPTATFGTIDVGVIGREQEHDFTFNEAVTGLHMGDFSATSATVNSVTDTGDRTTYTIAFTPTAKSFTLTLAADTVMDTAATPNTGPATATSASGTATRISIASLDGDESSVSLNDAKFLYYAYALGPALNDGTVQARVLSPLTSAEDSELGNLLTAARSLLIDLNENAATDTEDAMVFYYSFALEASLGNGDTEPGILEIKKAILGPLAATNDITGIDQMLRRIHTLRGE